MGESPQNMLDEFFFSFVLFKNSAFYNNKTHLVFAKYIQMRLVLTNLKRGNNLLHLNN